MDDIAKNRVINVFGLNPSAFDNFPYGRRGEIAGWYIL
jgi:hypothetical protein